MKAVLIKRFIACVLVLTLLAVSGIASAQSIAHESAHSHHQKATHSSVLCSWMCAAGQILDAFHHIPEVQFRLLATEPELIIQVSYAQSFETSAPRGPPVFSI